MHNKKKILFYGYGNPGRQDDALGISFIHKMEKWVKTQKLDNVYFDTNYQLNIEDADKISQYDLVIFADASLEPLESFDFTRVNPSAAQVEFTMHAVSVSFVLDLCQKIYDQSPDTYLLHIKGYEWDLDFDKGLSLRAEKNLADAVEFIKEKLWTL